MEFLPHHLNVFLFSSQIALLANPQLALSYSFPDAKDPLVNSSEVSQLNAISKGVSALSQKASTGIVFVSIAKTVQYVDPFEFFFGDRFDNRGGPPSLRERGHPQQEKRSAGLGSGFIVDLEKGYIITNNHVIDGADEITLKLANGQSYDAKVIGQDENTDVAVVQINDKNYDKTGLSELSLANSDEVDTGDIVIALGAPFGLEASASLGIISAKGRGNLNITRLGNFLQTDAAINPGNSGGPLLNTNGHVIGMNSAIFSKSGGYAGIGFAVPSNLVRSIAEQLATKGKVERGYIGVNLQPLDPNLAKSFDLPKGVTGSLVADVVKAGPAEKAGLQPGDVVIAVNGKETPDTSDLINEIGLMPPNSEANLTVFRSGKKRTFKVKIGHFPGSPSKITTSSKSDAEVDKDYGFSVAPNDSGLGVVITNIDNNPKSPANRADLQPSDVIVSVNNAIIKTPNDFWKILKSSSRVTLRVKRGDGYFFVVLKK